ncbi:MAG: hypothetical protein AAF617_11855 [Bacteroidota bacterium]
MNEDFLDDVGKDPRRFNRNSNNNSNAPQRRHEEQPPQKNTKKKWYVGCGCLSIIAIALAAFVYWAASAKEAEEAKDLRLKYLNQDIARLSTAISEDDVYSKLAKMCIDSTIRLEDGGDIDKSGIKYFSRRNNEKLLIILKVKNLKKVDASSRRAYVDALLDCFSYVEDEMGIEKYYISVEGFWNTLLVKTPQASDLGGKFANKKLLLPFYNEYVKDSLPDLGD